MNRRKKMNTTLRKRNKKEKAKLAPKTKPTYISKAKRSEIDLENASSEVISETENSDIPR